MTIRHTAPRLPAALTPEAFAEACQWIADNFAGDEAHRMLDRLVTALLTGLGYGDGMDIFLRVVAQCHLPGTDPPGINPPATLEMPP